MTTIILAEKPDAAFRIAQALADEEPRRVEEGGAPYYEFTVNGKKHVCIPAVGHLFVLSPAKDENSRGWNYPVFSYEWVPTYMKRGTEWTEKYYRNMERVVKGGTDFIGATDFDTEGEVLLFNILRFLCGVKDAKRMIFSTLTKDELVDSYRNMSPHIMYPILESGLTRHMLDALWGFNVTRALTRALKNVGGGFAILSSGRVQSPTLALLLQRELEIRSFVPKPFWQLELYLNVDGVEVVATYERDKVWREEEADEVLRRCEGKDAVVKDVKIRRYRQPAPIPFNTTDLQAEAFNQFKFSPTQTMNIAESLYQSGWISYPRSSSEKLPMKIGYERILKALSTLKPYEGLVKKLLRKAQLVPREGVREDPAHYAVSPTWETPDLRKLSVQQRKVYDLIVRRFLSAFADEALREAVNIVFDVDGYNFIAIGKRTVEAGWMEFYEPYIAVEEKVLPELKVGQVLKVLKFKRLAKETQPPGRYSQGSIIKEMERRNLGTRATRSEILQTLYDRRYVLGKSIKVTKLGETVTKVLKDFCPRILSEELTRRFEEEMDLVSSGKKRREEVVEEAKSFLVDVLKDFKKNEEEVGRKLLEGLMEARGEERRLGTCPSCGSELRITRSKRTMKFFVGCGGYPKCTNSYPIPQNAKIQATGKVCGKCNTPIIQVRRKGKRPFLMCLDLKCESKRDWNKNAKQESKDRPTVK